MLVNTLRLVLFVIGLYAISDVVVGVPYNVLHYKHVPYRSYYVRIRNSTAPKSSIIFGPLLGLPCGKGYVRINGNCEPEYLLRHIKGKLILF